MLDAGQTTPTAIFRAADLRRAVALAARVIERRNTIPILGTIRLTANADTAMLRATNLDMEITIYLEAIEATGAVDFTIAPRLFASLLRWAEGEVTISTAGDLVTIRIDDVEAQIRDICSPATDWPEMIGPVSDQTAMAETVMHRALSACIPCISTEVTRYYLNGVYLHQVDGLACLVTTDGHRLAKYQTAEAWPFSGQIIHTSTVKLLHRILKPGGNGQIIAMAAPEQTNSAEPSLAPKQPANRVEFRGDGWRLVSKTIDGSYPDYTRVIPQEEPTITAVLTHHALRRFGETSERSRGISIDPVAGRMTYQQPDGPTISMPVQASGKQSIGFNLGYLRDFTAQCGTIRLETKGPGDPARVLTDDPALLQILMPMMVR